MYQNDLGLNGVLLDKALPYYLAVGQENFNAMMEHLTELYPRVVFILNHDVSPIAITPLPGTTWASRVIVSPTLVQGTDSTLDGPLMKTLYDLYGGRVLLHLDANPIILTEPMNVFGELTSSEQVSLVRSLVSRGLRPLSPSAAYNFLFPVLGAATCDCALPPSTLYNSLSYGLDPRGTLQLFTPEIVAEASA